MKRNIFLILLFGALLFFAYQKEEVGNIKLGSEENRIKEILDFSVYGKIKELKGSSFNLVLTGGTFYLKKGNTEASIEKMEDFFQELSFMKIRRELSEKEIEGKEDSFFSENASFLNFIFENNKVKFTLGKKLAFNKDFYIKLEDNKSTKYLVAYSLKVMPGIYDEKSGHLDSRQYDFIKSVFTARDKDFIKK